MVNVFITDNIFFSLFRVVLLVFLPVKFGSYKVMVKVTPFNPNIKTIQKIDFCSQLFYLCFCLVKFKKIATIIAM